MDDSSHDEDSSSSSEEDMEFTTVQNRKTGKRRRDVDVEGVSPSTSEGGKKYKTVTGGPKPVVKSLDMSLVVFLKGKTSNITLLKPDTVRKEITEQFGAVHKIERSGNSLRITCTSEVQCDKLLKSSLIISRNRVEVSEPRNLKKQVESKTESKPKSETIKVVIVGVPHDVTDDEIMQASGAQAAFRLKKTCWRGTRANLGNSINIR